MTTRATLDGKTARGRRAWARTDVVRRPIAYMGTKTKLPGPDSETQTFRPHLPPDVRCRAAPAALVRRSHLLDRACPPVSPCPCPCLSTCPEARRRPCRRPCPRASSWQALVAAALARTCTHCRAASSSRTPASVRRSAISGLPSRRGPEGVSSPSSCASLERPRMRRRCEGVHSPRQK